jgi:hypothetical protein
MALSVSSVTTRSQKHASKPVGIAGEEDEIRY